MYKLVMVYDGQMRLVDVYFTDVTIYIGDFPAGYSVEIMSLSSY